MISSVHWLVSPVNSSVQNKQYLMITERNKTISFWATSFVIPHNPSITADNKREDGKVSSKNQNVLQDWVTRSEVNPPYHLSFFNFSPLTRTTIFTIKKEYTYSSDPKKCNERGKKATRNSRTSSIDWEACK